MGEGKIDESILLIKKFTDIILREEGTNSAYYATALHNLAFAYQMKKQTHNVEKLYKKALKIRLKLFGPDHLATAVSQVNLGGFYFEEGRFGLAEPLFVSARKTRENWLGLYHVKVIDVINHIAKVKVESNLEDEAFELYRLALERGERGSGPEFPRLAGTLLNLAILHHRRSHFKKSDELLRRALFISQKELGVKHPHTIHLDEQLTRIRIQARELQ